MSGKYHNSDIISFSLFCVLYSITVSCGDVVTKFVHT